MLVSIPFSFVPSTTIVSSQMNSNFTAISDWANGNIGADNIGVIEDEVQWNITGTARAIDITSDSSVSAVQIQSSLGKALEIVGVSGTFASLNGEGKWETVNTTSLDWTSNLALVASVGGNELTLALKSASNTNHSPTEIGYAAFRAATATSGIPATAKANSPASLVVPSGATLGLLDNENYCYLYLINNAGVIELAVTATQVDETIRHSTVAISGTATSNRVLYSTSSRTNVAVRCMGKIICPQTVSGVYATAPTDVYFGPLKIEAIHCQRTAGSGTAQSVLSGGNDPITFNATLRRIDPSNCFSGGNQTFTAPRKMRALVCGYFATSTAIANNQIASQITLNSVPQVTAFGMRDDATGIGSSSIQFSFLLDKGDVLELNAVSSGPAFNLGNRQFIISEVL